MEKYDQYLKANGLFDFDDMIEFAIHYLKTGSRLPPQPFRTFPIYPSR